MKRITLISLIAVIAAACSTHQLKCHGPLRPINSSTVSAPGSHAVSSKAPDKKRGPQS
jgi:hypothetical protein